MTDRIKILLKSYHLSPSLFADEINVQRSSISHILSGRNKPSLDFVTKILTHFPKVNAEWLILGKGNMFINPVISEKENEIGESTPGKKNTQEEQVIEDKPMTEAFSLNETTSALTEVNQGNKEINEIIIFYKNSTFKVYRPS